MSDEAVLTRTACCNIPASRIAASCAFFTPAQASVKPGYVGGSAAAPRAGYSDRRGGNPRRKETAAMLEGLSTSPAPLLSSWALRPRIRSDVALAAPAGADPG